MHSGMAADQKHQYQHQHQHQHQLPEPCDYHWPELCRALTKTVHRRANEILKRESDGNARGWRRYLDWEQQKWKQQKYDYYEDELFRSCYAISKLPWSVGISNKALEAVAAAEPACSRHVLAGGLAVCVGCGPGSDAIALLGRRHSQNPDAPLVLFLVDRCSGWRSLLTSVDEHLREFRLPYSLWFKPGCVKDADGARRLLPEADLIVLSFAHSVNADPNLWPCLVKRYKMVLVIDIASDALAETLRQTGFSACAIESQSAVSVFYHVALSGAGVNHLKADSDDSQGADSTQD